MMKTVKKIQVGEAGYDASKDTFVVEHGGVRRPVSLGSVKNKISVFETMKLEEIQRFNRRLEELANIQAQLEGLGATTDGGVK
jgi:hypothetical protein